MNKVYFLDKMSTDLLSRTGYASYDQMYRAERSFVYRVIGRIVRNDAVADEIAQDTFIRVLGSIDRYVPQEGIDLNNSLRSWLTEIAKNLAISRFKRRKLERSYVEEGGHLYHNDQPIRAEDNNPEDLVIQRGRLEILTRAIEKIPNSGIREAARLRYVEDLSYNEIGAELEIPQGTIMSRLYRARAHLRNDRTLDTYINE